MVLLDFSKAFDKVNHIKLLFKLSTHGIKGKTLKWISSFLGGRTQAVVLERECSPEVSVTSGVPQGSVLGPLLFLLYINDLPENIRSEVRLFVDDTAVYLTVNNPNDSKTLQNDLDTLQTWAWNSTLVNVRFCTSAEQISLSNPNIPCMVRFWSLLTVHVTLG